MQQNRLRGKLVILKQYLSPQIYIIKGYSKLALNTTKPRILQIVFLREFL